MNELETIHEQVFGVAPVVIGLHWDELQDRIIAAIESGTPYNEEAELSIVDLAAYKRGELVF
jgi:hypothetical protein